MKSNIMSFKDARIPKLMENINSLLELFNPETLIRLGGIELVTVIIFLETGIILGFFLPGDSLLFITGMLCSSNVIKLNVFLLALLLIASATAGSSVGYLFGTKTLARISGSKRLLALKKNYLVKTERVFERFGMWVFVLGRFVPGIRTFVPIFAGVSNIGWKKFMVYNVLGSIVWVCTMLVSGYTLGRLFPVLAQRIELIVVGIIGLTLIPFMYRIVRSKKRGRIHNPIDN